MIEIQLDVLHARDAHGRLTTQRDSAGRLPPRLFLGRSGERNVWAVRRDLDPATTRDLERLCAAEPKLATPSPERPPACRDRVLDLLAPIEVEWSGPAYVLPGDLPRDDRAREVTSESSSEWAEAFPWLVEEFDAVGPVAIAFDAGQAAAVCHSPARSAHAAEAGVETREAFRGRGLATAAVACWARAVQRSGRVALYSTSWQNTASQAVARRLSARLYGEDWHLT